MVALMRVLRIWWLSMRVAYYKTMIDINLRRLTRQRTRMAKAFAAYDTAMIDLIITKGFEHDATK